MSLMNFLKNNKHDTLSKTIQQIVVMAGDGVLGDGTKCSEELREFLKVIDRKYLKTYADQCLENGFANSGFVLQDIVNEIGRRMGFDITHGNYQGKRNQNNPDGNWKDGDSGWSFIVEVKTTDAYTIKLEKIASWLENPSLSKDHQESCLIVVGRKDTLTLEDQLRGSRYNWIMRIVGFESLYKALILMEKSEGRNLRTSLVDIFKPREFVRIDEILSVALDFSEDREGSIKEEIEAREAQEITEQNNKKHHIIESDREGIEELKNDIVRRIEKKYDITLIRRRSIFESRQKNHRYVFAVSKLYEKKINPYWYSIRSKQIEYLNEVDNAFFVMGCLDTKKAFAIPMKKMGDLIENMNSTSPKGDDKNRFFHVLLRKEKDKNHFIYTPKNRKKFHVDEFEIENLG